MKQASRFALVCAGMAFGLIAAPFNAVNAAEEVRVPALTAPFGAGITEQAVIFERLIAKRHPWLRVVAQESPGFVYNLKEMSSNKKRHKTTATWSSTGALWAAATAQKPFFNKKIPGDMFRWVVTRSSNCIWFGTLDGGIKTIKDFSGQKIGLGRRSQTHWGLFTTKAIQVGMGVNDANLEYLGNHAAVSAMLDGRVKVAVMLATMTADQSVVFPAGPLRKLAATGRKFYHISIPVSATQKVNADLKAPFVAHKLPAKTVPNQPNPLECLGDFVFMAVHKSFSDKIAYEITKVYLDIDTAAGKYLGGGKLYRRKSMCTVPKGIEPHPASLKACKDMGQEPNILK